MAVNYRYINKSTAIHDLNPLAKLAWTIVIVVLTLIYNNPLYILTLFCGTLPLMLMAEIKTEWKTALKFSILLGLVIILINMLFSTSGAHILYQAPFHIPLLGSPRLTLEAIFYGLGNTLRLITIISAFTIFTLTTHPDDMMLMMQSLKLPYKTILVASLSTRFVPALIQDVKEIRDTQQSKGLELHQTKLSQKIKRGVMIIIPLLSNSLDRAVQIAEAMESRGFGAMKNRTFYKEIRYSKIDFITILLIVSCFIAGLWIRLQGWGDYEYYPVLDKLLSAKSDYIALGILSLFLFTFPLVADIKRRIKLD